MMAQQICLQNVVFKDSELLTRNCKAGYILTVMGTYLICALCKHAVYIQAVRNNMNGTVTESAHFFN